MLSCSCDVIHRLFLLWSLQMLATIVVLRTGKMLGIIAFPDLDVTIPGKVRRLFPPRTFPGSIVRHDACRPRCSLCLCCTLGIRSRASLGRNDSSESLNTPSYESPVLSLNVTRLLVPTISAYPCSRFWGGSVFFSPWCLKDSCWSKSNLCIPSAHVAGAVSC